MNAIEIRGLEKHYPGFDLRLDLDLPQGCILGLIGENGAGKSTTIKSILGMIRPDAGSITVLGRDNSKNFAPVREDIGVVLDEGGLPQCLNAAQLGRVMSGIYRNWDQAVYEDYLKKLSLPKDKAYKDFSRGMKMKQAIAVALSHHPKLLVLDEPFVGLDPKATFTLKEIMHEMCKEGTAIFFSTHVLDVAEKLCNKVAIIKQGKIIAAGTMEELTGNQSLEEVFLEVEDEK